MTKYTQYKIDLSTPLIDGNKLDTLLTSDDFQAMNQAIGLSSAFKGYKDEKANRQGNDTAAKDAGRYGSVTIITADKKPIEISFSSDSFKSYEAFYPNKSPLNLRLDYLRSGSAPEYPHPIAISKSQESFIETNFHQNDYPSLMASMSADMSKEIPYQATTPQRIFRLDKLNKLKSAEYAQTYNEQVRSAGEIKPTEKSGTFRVTADLSNKEPKISLKYLSKKGLAMVISHDIEKALGSNLSSKTIFNAPKRGLISAKRKLERAASAINTSRKSLREFMKTKANSVLTTVVASATRNRSASKSNDKGL